MRYRKNLKYIFCCLVVSMAFALTGNAFAQHEGGLGIKRIHLNIADKDQLMEIEGMTEDLAKAIIESANNKKVELDFSSTEKFIVFV